MKLEINGLVGVSRLAIDIDRICVIAGVNGVGKTTVADALIATLTGDPLVRGLKHLNKTTALIRDGHKTATATLTGDKGFITVSWPKNNIKQEGTPPQASDWAVGRKRLAGATGPEVAALIGEMFGGSPGIVDLAAAFKEHSLPEKAAPAVWNNVEEKGWDGAHRHYRERGAEYKGRWSAATGEKFGASKSEDWESEGWHPAFNTENLEDMKDRLVEEKAVLEGLIGDQAIDENTREGLEGIAEPESALTEQLAEMEEQKSEFETNVLAAQATRDELPDTAATAGGVSCPWGCLGKRLLINRQGAVIQLERDESEEISAGDRMDIGMKIASADGLLANAGDSLRSHWATISDIKAKLAAARAAQEKLQDSQHGGGSTQQQVDSARTRVTETEALYKKVVSKRAADKCLRAIQMNNVVIEALKPEGLRKRLLGGAIEKFNAEAKKLTDIAKTAAVRLDADLDFWFDGRFYSLLSAGERAYVDFVLQATIARIDKSQAVVVDQVEHIKEAYFNGVLRIAAKLKIPTVLCRAQDNEKETNAWPIAKAGLGVMYWLRADGELVTL